jgi:hypothetical protein
MRDETASGDPSAPFETTGMPGAMAPLPPSGRVLTAPPGCAPTAWSPVLAAGVAASLPEEQAMAVTAIAATAVTTRYLVLTDGSFISFLLMSAGRDRGTGHVAIVYGAPGCSAAITPC